MVMQAMILQGIQTKQHVIMSRGTSCFRPVLVAILACILAALLSAFGVLKFVESKTSILGWQVVNSLDSFFVALEKWILPIFPPVRQNVPSIAPAPTLPPGMLATRQLVPGQFSIQVFFVARPLFALPEKSVPSNLRQLAHDFFTLLKADHVATRFRIVSNDGVVLLSVEISAGVHTSFGIMPNLKIGKDGQKQLEPEPLFLDVVVSETFVSWKSLDIDVPNVTSRRLAADISDFSDVIYMGNTSLATMKQAIEWSVNFAQTHPVYNLFELADEQGITQVYPLTCQQLTYVFLSELGFDLRQFDLDRYTFVLKPKRSFKTTIVSTSDREAIEFVENISNKSKAPTEALKGAEELLLELLALPEIYIFGYTNSNLSEWKLFKTKAE